jgi:small subunit ribosomal protein S8|tara:strand:+ start:10638 stop:11030 length:393 start_codon:yes stop_codon:yes gene_type:complete
VVNDTISDLLTRIRNAILANHQIVKVPKSNKAYAILKVLYREKLIQSIRPVSISGKDFLLVILSSPKQKVKISKLKRISKPSVRVYKKYKDIPTVLGGFGLALISTSKGILTDMEARQQRLGGEILCFIW